MKKPILLVVDNDPDYLRELSKGLERKEFEVVTAIDIAVAKRILEQKPIDLAVIDIRLVNEDDQHDISGLELAKEVARSVPKIIVTRYPTVTAVREALGPNLHGLPPTVDFIDKREGLEVLVSAIRRALAIRVGAYKQLTDGIVDDLKGDYMTARQQSISYFRVSMVVSLAGIAVIIAGIVLSLFSMIEIGIASAMAGILTETIAFLFFKRADVANIRMDLYHSELLEMRRLETLLAACDDLPQESTREVSKRMVVEIACQHWFDNNRPKPEHA